MNIDLGFGIALKKQSLRLSNIDTPEIRGEEREDGLVSKEFLSNLILGKDVIIKTNKDSTGKYGRWLAEIYLGDLNINDHLLNEGYAESWL